MNAIVARVVCWGLYKRMFDGTRVFESWLWGFYRRVKIAVPRMSPTVVHDRITLETVITGPQVSRRPGPIPLAVRHAPSAVDATDDVPDAAHDPFGDPLGTVFFEGDDGP